MRDFLPKMEQKNLVFREYLANGKNFSQIDEKFTLWVVICYLGSNESGFEPIAKCVGKIRPFLVDKNCYHKIKIVLVEIFFKGIRENKSTYSTFVTEREKFVS